MANENPSDKNALENQTNFPVLRGVGLALLASLSIEVNTPSVRKALGLG